MRLAFFARPLAFSEILLYFNYRTQADESRQRRQVWNEREFTFMKEIHDRGYKKLFSNLEIFRQLIMAFVRKPWVKDLDFSKCELV